MLSHKLLEEGATFASCVVPHPLETDLLVTIESAQDCKECLLSALRGLCVALEQCQTVVQTKLAHDEAVRAAG